MRVRLWSVTLFGINVTNIIATWTKPNGSRLRLHGDGRLIGTVPSGRTVTIRRRPVELPTYWTEYEADRRATELGFVREGAEGGA